MEHIEDFVRTVRRPYPPLYASLILEGMQDETLYRPLMKKVLVIKDTIHTGSHFYYRKKNLEDLSNESFRSWMDRECFENSKKELFQRENELLVASTGKDIHEFFKAYINYMPAIMLVWRIDGPFEKHMRETLGNVYGTEEVDQVMSRLNIPLEDNFYKKEFSDLIQAQDIKTHVKKYEWFNSRFGSREAYTVQEAEGKLQGVNAPKFFLEQQKEKEKLSLFLQEVKEKLAEHSNLVDIMQFIIYYRTQRTDIINRAAYQAIQLVQAEAEKHGISYEQLIQATFTELQEKIPPVTTLNKRAKERAIIMDQGKISCYTGERAREIISLLQSKSPDTNQLSGTIASPGKITGTVRVILDASDFGKFQDGDILVTSMTSPNFVPIMQRAAGFVTDEGGITCHAAIIARELHKPCLIGTQKATDIFRDGDCVELDADQGIIRKIPSL